MLLLYIDYYIPFENIIYVSENSSYLWDITKAIINLLE